jgi:hypothetical protein
MPSAPILTDWSPDGRFLLANFASTGTRQDIWAIPVSGHPADCRPIPLVKTAAVETAAEFSPDGHWIVYLSDETGTADVVSPIPGLGRGYAVSARDGSAIDCKKRARGAVEARREGDSLLES